MQRDAAVSGSFYPSDPGVLSAQVAAFIDAGHPPALAPLRALVVPHAGYIYSGPTAGVAYAALRAQAAAPRRILLLGPAHRVALRGLALSTAEAWATPLGSVSLDVDGAKRLQAQGLARFNDEAHAEEHSLEVQLPFLQALLPSFSLLPVVVGQASADAVARLIDAALTPGTLLLLSTDLSHYLPYDQAGIMDRATAGAVQEGRAGELVPEGACGYYPLRGLLQVAQARGWRARLLDLRNSGDTAGDKQAVVGYGAWGFEGGRDA